ncbi:hypothetical protein ACWD00_35015 [Streptomyces viridiviolaceus]
MRNRGNRRPYRVSPSGRGIPALIGEGLTNRQIGPRLYLAEAKDVREGRPVAAVFRYAL